MKTFYKLLLCAPLLGGCQSSSTVDDLLAGRKIDYQEEFIQQQQALQYPPDLIAAGAGVEGTVSLSEYALRGLPELANIEELESAATPVEVAYRRDGRVRWIDAARPPAELWPQILNFWNDHMGLSVQKENEQAGVMETGWLDLRRGEIAAAGTRKLLDNFLNILRDSGNRDKFITRLESNDAGGTDVYVSHRHVTGQFDEDTGSFAGYEPAPNEVELEIEMMRRLMVYLLRQGDDAAEENAEVEEQIAGAEVAGAEGDYTFDETELLIRKSFLDSWRLVQIALDRGGFTIEDRDYENGIVYIRHSGGPESDQIFGKREGLFAKLFGDKESSVRGIRLLFAAEDGDRATRITADSAEDEIPLTEEQQSVILNLLYERLP